MKTQQQAEIDHFLSTGYHDDTLFEIWPGNSFIERCKNGEAALRSALISAVMKRAEVAVSECQDYFCPDINLCTKFTPMVQGLFPKSEQTIILDILERSVVFITPATIYEIIKNARWLSTAWNIANIYLGSLAAKPLGDEKPAIL